jgi:hypothetical protein
MGRGGDQSARAKANGKKIGRPPKPQIPLDDSPTKIGVATRVLAMDGPPDHTRACPCGICKAYPRNCKCFEQCGDCQKLRENCECEKYRPIKITCSVCHTIEDHKICHCEDCGWWEALLARDARLRKEARQYLTDRRDGKPAQGVFIGDTREQMQALERGNLPNYFEGSGNAARPHKPN